MHREGSCSDLFKPLKLGKIADMMPSFPTLSESFRIERLKVPPPGSRPDIRAVIDTDTNNEIDDQFALVHALLLSEFN